MQLAVLIVGVAYVIVPTVVSMTVFIMSAPPQASRALEVSFYLLMGGYAGLCENIKDVSAVLLFRELEANFRQVNYIEFRIPTQIMG